MAEEITGRDDYIIGQALAVAIDALSREKFPQHSNIEDMKRILEARYASAGRAVRHGLLLRRARALGWKLKEGQKFDISDLEAVIEKLTADRGDAVVDLHKPPPD